ncbi:Chromosome segregation in meiosis protein 3 [Erysiphe neolycopersici]|uniref:Chromosome segregation in meiosis protein n=1 Tax=Erysiphe neolycopersici TaxID=212602 RepID=A0A420HM26_9PEZI|nr:Chromosome segregation in meiosis protein 3 [Erysiphe neolycopersici]
MTSSIEEDNTRRREELEELFNYDAGVNDPFSDNYQAAPLPERIDKPVQASIHLSNDLGIDDEIELTRKHRVPRVKLDEKLLLSPAGIPKLQLKAKSFKFKGKGYEFSDISNLLNVYQLWLDDLFPKARFLDALALVEKLGHKKTIQAMRMSWINESKLSSIANNEPRSENPSARKENSETTSLNLSDDILPVSQENMNVVAEDDLYDATPQPMSPRDSETLSPSISILDQPAFLSEKNTNEVPDDELDTLMAEGVELSKKAQADVKMAYSTDRNKNLCFDDEEEAMAEMDLEW